MFFHELCPSKNQTFQKISTFDRDEACWWQVWDVSQKKFCHQHNVVATITVTGYSDVGNSAMWWQWRIADIFIMLLTLWYKASVANIRHQSVTNPSPKVKNFSCAIIPTNFWMHSTFDLIVFSISIISFVNDRTWIFNAWMVSFWFEMIVDFWFDNNFWFTCSWKGQLERSLSWKVLS